MRFIPNIPSHVRGAALNNLGAGAAPTVNDDSSLGYAPGSLWVWLSAAPNDASIGYGTWICTDATPGAAVWRRIEANNNLAAAANPIVTDDAASGYAVGSLWIWPGNSIWVCSDPVTGAAVWVQALASAAATQLIETGFDTTAMAVGELGYLSAANVVSPAYATDAVASRAFGAYEGSAGQMTIGGTVEFQRIESFPANITIFAGDRLYLSATDSGAVTNVAPGMGALSVGFARTAGTIPGGTVPMILELDGETSSQVIQTGLDTSVPVWALPAGELVYLSAADTVSKAIATSLATSRVVGAYEGGSQITVVGTIESQHIEAAITILAGDRLYLSAVTAGAVTNVRPSGATQVVVSVGYARTNGTGAGGTVPMLLELEDTDVPLNNLAGAVPPTVNDDSVDGYTIGSLWVGPNNDVWRCTDATAAAAVWTSLAEPAAHVFAGAGPDAIGARDIGNVIFASGAGAQAFTLPNLSASIGSVGDVAHPQAGRMAILTIQQENPATLVTITPTGAGVTINGSTAAYALAVGRHRESLCSRDGLNWFSTDANGLTVWGNAAIPITTNFNFADYPNGAVLLVDTSVVGPVSGQLPAPVRGLIWTVKDANFYFAINPFTAVRFAGEKIARVAGNYLFAESGGDITLVADGTDWWLISPTYQQPRSTSQGGAYALAPGDIGNVVFAIGAGAQAFTLPTMAPSLMAGRMLMLTIVCENVATAVTITPDAASQINNAGLGVAYVAPPGATVSLKSRNGTAWVAR